MVDKESLDNTAILWEKVRANIKKELSEQSFATWIEPLSLLSFVNDTVVLGIPNSFFSSWLREHYHDLITSSFAAFLQIKPTIDYVVDEQLSTNASPQEKTQEKRETAPKNSGTKKEESIIDERYTFETFVVGSGTRFAHAAAYAVAESPAKKYNPLFIYGQVGLGKTHLLQAIAYESRRRFPKIKTHYISSEKFTNLLISAIQNKSTMAFRQKFRTVDILLIDDIHFIAGKEATQEEFFHTFNDLYDRQKQIVLTSDRPPKEIPGLEERLVSRFEWGLVTDIQPPDFETRVAILKKKMEKETIVVPDDVAFFIADNIKSNIRELEGALIRVVAYSQLVGHTIDLELVKTVLKDAVSEEEKKITIDAIQQKTADYFNIKMSDMRTKKRSRSIAYPRQVAMYLVRSHTDHSLPEIGEYFGGRDHTTVLYAIEKVEKEIKNNPRMQKTIDEIIVNIKRG